MARRRKHDHPRPLAKRLRTVLLRLRGGEVLCRSFRPRAIGQADDVNLYWCEPSGRQVAPKTAHALVATGMLTPRDPGLFGAGDAQSWGYAP